MTRPLGAVETGGRRQQGEGREAVLSTCQGPATGNWEMITCLSIVGTVRTMCGRAGARGSRPPLLMNSVRAACEVGPTRHAGGVACRRVTVRGRSNSYSYSYSALVLWGRAGCPWLAVPRARPETSRARAACTYARHACAPADLPAHLSLGFFARRSRTRTEGVVVSGGQSRSGRDRWASRTRRIAVQVAGGPWAASSSARSAHLCSPHRARRTRAESRKGASGVGALYHMPQ